MNRERSFQLLRTGVSLLIALLAAYLIIFLVSDTPLEAVKIFTLGPFDSVRHFGNLIEAAIPLIFSGLSMAVVFQAGLFNLGAEGIFYIAGAAGAALAIFVPMPAGIAPAAVIALGGAHRRADHADSGFPESQIPGQRAGDLPDAQQYSPGRRTLDAD